MAESEDVQYFQFDSQGNMFVFKPGSGFSGPSVKVEPGFEMCEVTQLTQSLSQSVEVSQLSAEISSLEINTLSSTPVKRSIFVLANVYNL